MRNPIESVPKDGQFVIVEDESGNDDVARWSSELEVWVGLNGEPTAVRPTHWWPIPTGRAAPSHEAPTPPPPPGFALPRLNPVKNSEPASAAQADPVPPSPVSSSPAPGKPVAAKPVAAKPVAAKPVAAKPVSAGLGDGHSNVVPLRNRATPASRRRSFPLFSVSLFGIVAAGALMASVIREDPLGSVVGSVRNAISWMRGLDSMSAAAKPPAARQLAEAAGPGDRDGVVSVAVVKVDGSAGADRGQAVFRPEPIVKHEVAALDKAPLQQKRQSSDANPNVKATSDIVALARGRADEASQARLARPVDGVRSLSDRPALQQPAESAEIAKHIERASQLLKQGYIGAARLVLAHAHELGSPRAGFMLAETYDPRILATWTAIGTQADPAMARELYAKAYGGGIAEAKARLEALAE